MTRSEVAELLGDPEADVGRARNEGRVGKAPVELGKGGDVRRGGEKPAFVADEKPGRIGERRERGRALGRSRSETIGRRAVAGGEARGQDRAIAGAAAKIAGELVVEAGRSRGRARVIGGEQAHHDPGRAEAALRAVMVDHRLLHRMECVADREILDRDEFGPVKLAEQQDAGVHRLISKLAAA